MNPFLAIGQILLSIALIAAILLQARGTGLSGTFGGDSAVYRSRRGIERRLWQFTIVLLVLFILFALVSFVTVPARRASRSAGRTAQARPPSIRLTTPCRSPAATTRSSSSSCCPSSSSAASSRCRRPRRTRRATPEPTPEATLPPPITYREGVVGVPATIMPVAARTRSERTSSA